MYLHNATSLDEVITFGTHPLLALMEYYEDEFLDLDNPESQETIFWNEIKGKALLLEERIKEIHRRERLTKKINRAGKWKNGASPEQCSWMPGQR